VRPPPPGGPVGAKRRNAREKEPPQRRRAGMIDAAHRWKARATDGCHRHLTRNHKLVPAHQEHSMAEQIPRTRREGPLQRDRD